MMEKFNFEPETNPSALLAFVVSYGSLALFTIWLLLTGGCAPGLDGARQVLANAMSTQVAASQMLREFDAKYQDNLVEQTALDCQKAGVANCIPVIYEAKKTLEAYRAKRKVAVDAIKYSANSSFMLEALLPAVQLGVEKQKAIAPWISTLVQAGQKIYEAFVALGLKPKLGGL